MGNKQKQSKYSSYDYDYSSSNYKKKEDEEKNIEYVEKEEDNSIWKKYINSETEYSSSNSEKIIKVLEQMNLSYSEVKENFDFYKNNFSKLLKINKIITNIKYANLFDLFD